MKCKPFVEHLNTVTYEPFPLILVHSCTGTFPYRCEYQERVNTGTYQYIYRQISTLCVRRNTLNFVFMVPGTCIILFYVVSTYCTYRTFTSCIVLDADPFPRIETFRFETIYRWNTRLLIKNINVVFVFN